MVVLAHLHYEKHKHKCKNIFRHILRIIHHFHDFINVKNRYNLGLQNMAHSNFPVNWHINELRADRTQTYAADEQPSYKSNIIPQNQPTTSYSALFISLFSNRFNCVFSITALLQEFFGIDCIVVYWIFWYLQVSYWMSIHGSNTYQSVSYLGT